MNEAAVKKETAAAPGVSDDGWVRGELVSRDSWTVVRVLFIVTGLILVRGLLTLVARYCLGLRRRARARIEGRTLVLTVTWSIMGRQIRETRTVAPFGGRSAVRLEIRQHYLYLLVGFGALVVSTFFGVQWFAQGLRAGYPYLALVGAGVVAAGVAVDLLLYFLIPEAKGKSRLLIALGPWRARLAGVASGEAVAFVERFQSIWDENAGPGE